MTKKSTILTITIALVLLIIIAMGWWYRFVWLNFINSPLLPRDRPATTIKIKPGTGALELAWQLRRQAHMRHPKLFVWLIKYKGVTAKLKSGEYQLTKQMSPQQFLTNVVLGKVLQRRFLLVAGFTFQQVRTALAKEPNLRHDIEKLSDQQVMQRLGSRFTEPTGLFFPDTYYFTWGDSDLVLLKKAYGKMQLVLRRQWQERSQDLPYKTPYAALIVASMIEKETALRRERPLIAGVILQRLRKNMRLQIDPTVLFGLGKPYGTPITRQDLKTDTPYNTYLRRGLPPTPIAMPSKASINAALHPQWSRYLYYVAKGDGGHDFSETYAEHEVAVAQYRAQQRAIKQKHFNWWRLFLHLYHHAHDVPAVIAF